MIETSKEINRERGNKKASILKYDPLVIKELTEILVYLGWEYEPDQHTILYTQGQKCLIYLRKLKLLQIYWKGYGTQALESDLFSFETAQDIVTWTEQLNVIELVTPGPDTEELDHLTPTDIINSIFS